LPSNGGGLIKLDSNASEILVTNFLHWFECFFLLRSKQLKIQNLTEIIYIF
jgi:hypothetical protein